MFKCFEQRVVTLRVPIRVDGQANNRISDKTTYRPDTRYPG